MTTPRTNAGHDQNNVTTLVGVSTVDGYTPVPIEVDPLTGQMQTSGGAATSSTATTGAASFATGQQALSTSAAVIAASRATRTSITIVNLSAIDIYIGGSGVTTATGQLLLGTKGTAITLSVVGAVYGIAASGTPSVSYEEEYN